MMMLMLMLMLMLLMMMVTMMVIVGIQAAKIYGNSRSELANLMENQANAYNGFERFNMENADRTTILDDVSPKMPTAQGF